MACTENTTGKTIGTNKDSLQKNRALFQDVRHPSPFDHFVHSSEELKELVIPEVQTVTMLTNIKIFCHISCVCMHALVRACVCMCMHTKVCLCGNNV